MAVSNSMAQRTNIPDRPVEYQVNGEPVKLSPKIVRDYLVSGGGNVSDQEVVFFLNLCKHQKLNPFVKDAYIVKYGNSPAAIVTSIGALLKRAKNTPTYAGHLAGVVVRDKNTGAVENRVGSLVLEGEDLVGGWAKVYVKGYEVPQENAVSLSEYIGTKSDGSVNSMWSGKPGTMIRKVALAGALRECFPDDMGQLYAQEEIPGAEVEPDIMPGQIDQDTPPEAPAPQDDIFGGEPMETLPGGF